ncbi:MAG: restriction endonuclease [Lachnospiraceae bacterium]|nr:restriction endonuclease [Lachnospiraceae bacterium]
MEYNLPIIIGAAILLLCMIAIVCLRIAKRRRPKEIDLMEGHEFEQYCANLLEEHGFQEVEVTRGSGDFGVDVLAQREGISYAIQCKRYDGPVGVHAIQEVYAGRDYYDCMVGVVMTNQYFTAPAVEVAQKLKILLWDRDYLETLEEEDYQE